jgi:hypothetical protein
VARLNAVINETLKSPEIAATLVKLAVDAKSETPGNSARSGEKWSARAGVKAAGIVGNSRPVLHGMSCIYRRITSN